MLAWFLNLGRQWDGAISSHCSEARWRRQGRSRRLDSLLSVLEPRLRELGLDRGRTIATSYSRQTDTSTGDLDERGLINDQHDSGS
jgi:hypothetical protein